MNLGRQHLALNVKDIVMSKSFYENLGFSVVLGSVERKLIIMKNGETTIGLYQNIIPKNTLTFNNDDVRGLQRDLKNKGMHIILEANENTIGPAHFLIVDPDGNPIFFDQHR